MCTGQIVRPRTSVRVRLNRIGKALRHDHEHTILSATALLSATVILSRCIGYAREAYIAYAFGAQQQTDAYVAAFTIPDILYSLLAGGTMTITLTAVLTRLLSEEGHKRAQKSFSVIVTVVPAVLFATMLVAGIIAPQCARILFPKFTPDQLSLCVRLIRILLPARLLLYVGTMMSAVVLSKCRFFLPTVAPLLLNLCVLAAGALAGSSIGITSLAVGALLGALLGPCVLNAIGLRSSGFSCRPSFDVRDPGLRMWSHLALPMMLSISMFNADNWFLWFFASGMAGDITRLHYAKQLLFVPVTLLGSTSSQAAVPFLAKLFAERRPQEFEETVNQTVYWVSAVTLLAASWIISVSLPLCDSLLRRGRFEFADSQKTALYLSCLAFSLVFWSLLMTYGRAFSAAMDTLTPAATGTLTAVFFFPVYRLFFHLWSTSGLAVASDLAVAVNVVSLAALLHCKGVARLTTLRCGEIVKVLGVAVAAGIVGRFAIGVIHINGTRSADVRAIAFASVCWLSTVAMGLSITRSAMLNYVKERTGLIGGSKRDDAPKVA
jgi:putative peptidoglycan lipid II flippase